LQPLTQPKNNQPKISWVGGEFRTKCVVGLDRDGVINRDLGTYCHKVEDFDPIPGSIDAIAELRRKGYKITVITDQGGIEKGIYTQQDVDTVHEHMLKLLGEAGCFSIDGIYYSASSRKEDPFAKPNTGMFKKCEADTKDIKFKEGYYVGDKMKDLKAAMNIGARPVLVRTGYGLETEKDLQKWTYRKVKQRTIIFDDLAQFVESLA
jgi:D-glycero-D-manno-heptose 1,7-bisphosphate phosphatase